jgi:penicillin-binding protein 1C
VILHSFLHSRQIATVSLPILRSRYRGLWALPFPVLFAAGLISLTIPLPREVASEEGIASLRVTDREGRLLRELFPAGSGHPVDLASVNPAVIDALIATEDRRFYTHPGIDLPSLGRAAHQNLRSRRVISGGSTITMQVARALRSPQGRGVWTKLTEAHLALRLELRLSKEQILALWLNRASFGNRSYGIEAAAQTYFGKSAADLTLDEATLLIGLPQAPSRLDPFLHPERALARRQRVLNSLHRTGMLGSDERERLADKPLTLVQPRRAFHAPHFVEWVARQAPEGAVELRTTLDRNLQLEVEAIVRGHVVALRAHRVSAAAAVVLDNRTGEILAYVGSPDFWDVDASGQVDGVRALRQPGSALKPFTYALAFDDGRWTPATIIPDLDLQVLEAGGAFSPANYDRQFHGPVSARTALASSLNVPAVRVARALGTDALLDAMRSAGFTSLTRSAEHYGVGLTLGSGEVRLIDLARAYAGLARGGSLPAISAARWAAVARGDTLQTIRGEGTGAWMRPATAYLITDILADPQAREIGFGRGGPLELPFPAAVKTGTTKDYRDNWAVGYTPRHTVAVWIGNFENTPMQWVSGTRGTGPMLNAILTTLGSGGAFVRPESVESAAVCPASGARPGAQCPAARNEVFLAGSVPSDTCGVHRLVRIDRRSGLFASSTTPVAQIEARVYTVHPPEYHAWMRKQRMPLPPTATEATAASLPIRMSERLQIDYPGHGTVFHLDPVLRHDYQRVRLRGAADGDLVDVAWFVNDERFSDDLHSTDWPLAPGTHTLELRAVTPEGQRLGSVPATVTIRGGSAPSASL